MRWVGVALFVCACNSKSPPPPAPPLSPPRDARDARLDAVLVEIARNVPELEVRDAEPVTLPPVPTFAGAEPRAAAPPAKDIRRAAISPVDDATLVASKQAVRDGERAAGAKQFEVAITAFERAIKTWPANALAYYGVGTVNATRGQWRAAVDAFETTVAIAPDVAMFRMWYGIALAESTRLDEAAGQLAIAVKLEDRLWRAHFYLGRVERDRGRPAEAATEFGKAIERRTIESGPYIALVELYRKWAFADLAIAVGQLGSTHAVDASIPDVWFALAHAYEDRGRTADAKAAFAKAGRR